MLDELGLREQALPPDPLPLDPDLVVAGPAIEGRPHPNIDREGSMLAIFESSPRFRASTSRATRRTTTNAPNSANSPSKR